MTVPRIITATFLLPTLWSASVCARDDKLPRFVGRRVCLECHDGKHEAPRCSQKPEEAHTRSYEALSTPPAEHIALVSGVPEEPVESRICLGCHATGADVGPRWWAPTFDATAGVQCEACHGAGSLHVTARRENQKDYTIGGVRTICRSSEAECKHCHKDRASHQLVLDQNYRVPATDRLYKTPVNLAVSPDGKWLYVVCEHGNSLIIVDTAARQVVSEIAVGNRPQDVGLSPDGKIAYVTNRLSDTMSVVDTVTRSVVTELSIGDEPHGVLTDPSGNHLYILNTQDDSISLYETKGFTEVKRLTAGRGPWSIARNTDGDRIAVTNVRPNPARFREPPVSEVTLLDTRRGVVTARATVPDASMLEGIAFIPNTKISLFTLLRTKNLVPITRLAQGWTITNGLGVVWPDGRVDQVLLDEPNSYFPDPGDVAVSPDGRIAFVTSGGSDQVAVVDVERLLTTIRTASDHDRQWVLPNHMGMSERFVVKRLRVGTNPRGIVFSPDGRFAYVVNALDDSLSVIDARTLSVDGTIDLGGPFEITEIRWGEQLFHSADNAFGRQFSCRSCHPDGHINGLNHDIEADGVGIAPVDNRTLRGIVDTAPFKWEGTNPSLRRQCGPRLAVFFARLEPFDQTELTALVRYMCTIQRPPNRHRPPHGLTPAQYRGKLVFERTLGEDGRPIPEDRQCATCHNGSYFTSRKQDFVGTRMWFDEPVKLEIPDLFDVRAFGELGNAFMFDLGERSELDVPHLNNIYDSAPYLHNGAARTLEEVFTRFNLFEWHGDTRDLTRRQFNDLIAYLKSL
ncbi:MAG: beta-propeller fold lactonase family protein [Phycisphaerae bacterium]|jgi:YVTN family beta-propeller protein